MLQDDHDNSIFLQELGAGFVQACAVEMHMSPVPADATFDKCTPQFAHDDPVDRAVNWRALVLHAYIVDRSLKAPSWSLLNQALATTTRFVDACLDLNKRQLWTSGQSVGHIGFSVQPGADSLLQLCHGWQSI